MLNPDLQLFTFYRVLFSDPYSLISALAFSKYTHSLPPVHVILIAQ